MQSRSYLLSSRYAKVWLSSAALEPGIFERVDKRRNIMNSCKRCGNKLQHNYLVEFFKKTKEKVERTIVCLKCRDILKKKEEAV
ncbi:MAG: hypothetical protein PHG31_04790 [Candidatus Omnitrophica bacterium]|nr:hypothetical protein [Candidatus Omnitrophota bacterium]